MKENNLKFTFKFSSGFISLLENENKTKSKFVERFFPRKISISNLSVFNFERRLCGQAKVRSELFDTCRKQYEKSEEIKNWIANEDSK